MLKNKKSRNKKGYGKIKSTEEWLEKEHKKQKYLKHILTK